MAKSKRPAQNRLATDGRALEFVKDQYRHCKLVLVLSGARLLDKAELLSEDPDPGLVVGHGIDASVVDAFIEALGQHRHCDRESDPPLV